MTSLFSVEDVKFDPAQKVGFTNFSSNFVEETVQGLLGKGMFGGQKTSEMARQQARQGAFMRRLSEMDISDFQEVPQDDGDVWLVAATTVDGEVHHVHISENSIYDSFKLVEATPEEVEARKKHKFKFSKNLDGTDGALTEIDGKRYFVDMHILFNFGVDGTTKACTTFAMSLAGGVLGPVFLQEVLSYVGGQAFKTALKKAVGSFWEVVGAVLKGAAHASFRFLKTLLSGLINRQFDGLLGRCASAAGTGWRSAFVTLEEGAVGAAGWGALLVLAVMIIMYLIMHDTKHTVTIYNLTSKELLVSAPYMGHGGTDAKKEFLIPGYRDMKGLGKWYSASPIRSESDSTVTGIGLAMNLSLRETGGGSVGAEFACMFDIPFVGTNSLNAIAQKQSDLEQYYDANEGVNKIDQLSVENDKYEIIVTYDKLSGKQYDSEIKGDGYVYHSMLIVRDKVPA